MNKAILLEEDGIQILTFHETLAKPEHDNRREMRASDGGNVRPQFARPFVSVTRFNAGLPGRRVLDWFAHMVPSGLRGLRSWID